MKFRSLLWTMLVALLAIGFYGCASEEETEIQPEEVIVVESEEEETETKPVVIEIERKFDKHALMYKLWPEWDQYTYASKTDPGNPSGFLSMLDDFQRLFYPFEFSYGYGGGPATEKGVRMQNMAVLYENLDCTMYATKNQFVYSNLFPGNFTPAQKPYLGQIAGALEEGEEVHVLYSFFNKYRPQDGLYYVIGDRLGTPFLNEYSGQYVGNQYPQFMGGFDEKRMGDGMNCSAKLPSDKTIFTYKAGATGIVVDLSYDLPITEEKEFTISCVEVSDKNWMDEIWTDWKDYKYSEEQGYNVKDGSALCHDVFPQEFYPEEDYWTLFYPERYEDAVMVQKEKTDVIMYATERQLVYAEIMPTVEGPLKDPYYGPVVGALEKGEPVRVVSVIENQQRPEDGEYYGIAIDLELGSTPFLSEYMNPFVERFGADAFGSNSAAYGYAVKLSSTPPSE